GCPADGAGREDGTEAARRVRPGTGGGHWTADLAAVVRVDRAALPGPGSAPPVQGAGRYLNRVPTGRGSNPGACPAGSAASQRRSRRRPCRSRRPPWRPLPAAAGPDGPAVTTLRLRGCPAGPAR